MKLLGLITNGRKRWPKPVNVSLRKAAIFGSSHSAMERAHELLREMDPDFSKAMARQEGPYLRK